MIQHIYNNQQVRNHFPVRIWVCVSFSFNLDKVLEQIKRDTLPVEGENGCSTTQELIEHRLKYKRFLLVLDDIWQFTDVDDWKKLLLILGKSQGKGSMILVTTRQKEIADQVKKTEEPKELDSLEPGEFKKLFLIYVFDVEQYPEDKLHLLRIGDAIMKKLKCSPLAAKTVGRLLRRNPCLSHWKRVLDSKQWVKQNNGIMPALKLSYDFLPFHLQQCFSYSALFPEDYPFRSRELISLWIGLNILIPTDQSPTFEDIGLSNIKELVIHGFFREEETDGDPRYVMHDLLHDLALDVASHDCLSLRLHDVGSVKIKPSTRHLSISTENLGEYNAVFGEKLKSKLDNMTTFNVEHLQTLMLFGEMNEGFAKILVDFFGEANALRVLYLPGMTYPLESMLHNFSGLIHLRFLCLGTKKSQMHLPLNISIFYHLRVLDLESWYGSGYFPEDMNNLAKLCHYYTPRYDKLHYDICNVGKLQLLEKLKLFRVNKKNEGFEPRQLEPLTKLWELGIYNLEKIHIAEEAAQAKLVEKNCLRRLTLDWDSVHSSGESGMEAVVLKSLQPHENLEVLCIRGHKGSTCPTWLGDEFAVEALQSLFLDGVSWKVFPSLKNMGDLRELEIQDCPEFSSVISISWIESLSLVRMERVKLLEKFKYSNSSSGVELEITGRRDLHSFDQVLIFDKETCLEKLTLKRCPPLELKHLQMLTSLKKLTVKCLDSLVGPLGGQHEWKLPVEHIKIEWLNVISGKELTELLPHLPLLSKLEIISFQSMEMMTSATSGMEEEDDGVADSLQLAHMFPLLQVLIIRGWPKLLVLPFSNSIVSPNWFPGLQEIDIQDCPKFSSVIPTSLFQSLCHANIKHVELLEKFVYSKSSDGVELEIVGRGGLHSLDQVLIFDKETSIEKVTLLRCPPLELKHLQMLTSLKTLIVQDSDCLVGPLEGEGDAEWHLPIEHIEISRINGNIGKDLTELLPRLPRLFRLNIKECENIKQLVVGVDLQQTTSAPEMVEEEEEYGPELELDFSHCPELVLMDPPTLVPGRGGLQALQTLQKLRIVPSARFLSRLELCYCGEDLQYQGLFYLLTTGGQLKELRVSRSPKLFAGCDPNPRRALEDVEGGEEQQPLRVLWTDDVTGLLAAPICSLLSSSLTELKLVGDGPEGMGCLFSKEQEDALQLLSSLQQLEFWRFSDLQQLPTGLRNLTSLKKLTINDCPTVLSLSSDGLPNSLAELDVYNYSEELGQQCRGLGVAIPRIRLEQ